MDHRQLSRRAVHQRDRHAIGRQDRDRNVKRFRDERVNSPYRSAGVVEARARVAGTDPGVARAVDLLAHGERRHAQRLAGPAPVSKDDRIVVVDAQPEVQGGVWARARTAGPLREGDEEAVVLNVGPHEGHHSAG